MVRGANENERSASSGACPICGKRTDPAYRPFCSKRCADVDLQRWLVGRYAVPVVEGNDRQEDPFAADDQDDPPPFQDPPRPAGHGQEG